MKVRSLARLAGLALILFGIGALVYPTVSDRWNQLHATKLIETYQTTVSALSDDKYAELWQAAEDYNKALAANTARFDVTDESHEEYLSLLFEFGQCFAEPCVLCLVFVQCGCHAAYLLVCFVYFRLCRPDPGGYCLGSLAFGQCRAAGRVLLQC